MTTSPSSTAYEGRSQIAPAGRDPGFGRASYWDFEGRLQIAPAGRDPGFGRASYWDSVKVYEGGCHCGRVRFRVTATLERVSECNCSICAKKGFLHLIVPRDRFELVSGAEDLSTYEFNTRVAKHHFCRHCGIHSFYVPRSDPDKIDVNVRCLDGVNLDEVRPVRFDGLHWEEAIQRHAPWR